MTANIKENPNLGGDKLRRMFVELYSIADEPDPERLADEEMLNIYKDATVKLLSSVEENKKLDLETEMVAIENPQEMMDFLVNNFEAEELRKQLQQSAEVTFGGWVNSSFGELSPDKVERIVRVVTMYLEDAKRDVDGLENKSDENV
jgi:hypothetical protein